MIGNGDFDYNGQGEAWNEENHAVLFDTLSIYPDFLVKKHYELFNEVRFLKEYQHEISGITLFEIGCATGEFYRYLNKNMSRFNYHGMDVSKPAIARAKEKYGDRNFTRIDQDKEMTFKDPDRPDVIFCRDVVQHQERPYEFLDWLIQSAKEAVFLRVRTRDVGETVFDPNISCQLHRYKHWEPFIVLNTEEMIGRIKSHESIDKIVIGRRYEPLGGRIFRYLPKELYFFEAKSAETAIYIHKGKEKNPGDVAVEYRDQLDGAECYSTTDRCISRVTRTFLKMLKR